MEDNKTEVIKGYFQVPKSLFYLRRKGDLSLTAFDIYLLMVDRLKLSIKNGWKDQEGNNFIYYSYKELCEGLQITSERMIAKALKELKELGLIKSKRRFNASSIFYINEVPNITILNDSTVQKDSNDTVQKVSSETVQKVHTNNNNYNKNNNSKNNIYIDPPLPESKVATNKGAYLQTITLLCAGLDVNPKALVRLGKSLDRIKEVTTFGRENNWKGSWIYAAIRDDRDLSEVKRARKTSIEELQEADYTPSAQQVEFDKLIGLD